MAQGTKNHKRRKKWAYALLGSGLFIFFLFLGILTGGALSPLPFLWLESLEGKVVDAETKDPIPGAAVLVVYRKSVPGVAGSMSFRVDAQDTLTNDKGQFRIPTKLRWLSFHRGLSEMSEVTVFKAGYGVFPSFRVNNAGQRAKSTYSPDKGTIYELPKLTTMEERAHTMGGVRVEYDLPYSKQAILIGKVNEEFANIGVLDRYIAREGKPYLQHERKKAKAVKVSPDDAAPPDLIRPEKIPLPPHGSGDKPGHSRLLKDFPK